MDLCEEHRPYIGALADGELELVPARARSHVAGCPDCTAELEAHRLVTRRLHAGLSGAVAPPQRTPPRLRMRRVAVAALGVAAAAGLGVAGWGATHRSVDTVGAAVAASRRAPEIRSADATEIALWCSRSSDRRPPPVSIADLALDGARMDAAGPGRVVTVFYRTPEGGRIAVGWLSSEPSAETHAVVEAHQDSGRTVLVLHAPAGTAVVSGDVSLPQLWRVAGALEATTG